MAETKRRKGRPRVLYIDDDMAEREQLARRFTQRAFDFEGVASIEQGAARLEATVFQVVVVSAYQPISDSIAFLTAVRGCFPEAYRVLATASNDVDDMLAAINDAGVHRVVTGPLRRQSIDQTVCELVEQARADLERGQLAQRSRRHEEELQQLRTVIESLCDAQGNAVLDVLMSALCLRESTAPLHSRRAATYAARLGRACGLRKDELRVLELGALLHDVGKIGVSDDILCKPGSLEADEWAQMRRHPSLGFGLLNGLPLFGAARTIVMQHHERWDGRGYPTGLSGKQINLGARICALSDALDAMTSTRPYRVAMSFDEAWDEILSCRGSQFDPEIVDRFTSIGREVWERCVERQLTDDARHLPPVESVAPALAH